MYVPHTKKWFPSFQIYFVGFNAISSESLNSFLRPLLSEHRSKIILPFTPVADAADGFAVVELDATLAGCFLTCPRPALGLEVAVPRYKHPTRCRSGSAHRRLPAYCIFSNLQHISTDILVARVSNEVSLRPMLQKGNHQNQRVA